MANKYNFRFLGQHGNFDHIDLAIDRNSVEVGRLRLAIGSYDQQTAKEDVIDFALDLLESLKIQKDLGLITAAEAKTQFEAFELWR